MRETITNQQAIEMMTRCKEEIRSLRNQIAHLQPRAEAYDALVRVINLLPGKSMTMGEDLVWTLDQRIRALTPPPPTTPAAQ